MSISLPNGTLLANPSTQTQYTAAVTRILHLSSFPPELKTRDLQVMFKDYEAEKGGFRIKWLDDVNALVVFSDAGVAKRAYLSFLLSPPPAFPAPAKIRPYDRPDAAQIIQALTARSMGHRSSMSSAMTSGNVFNQSHSHTLSQGQGPIDGLPSHSRTMSMGNNGNPAASGGGSMGAFAFPKSGRSSISRPSSIIGGSTITSSHGRSGSSSFSRSSNSGLGALNFCGGGGTSSASSLSNRLPTHAESLDSPNRPSAPFPVRRTTKESELSRSASSSDTEPIVVMDQAPGLPSVPGFAGWKMPSKPMGARRESVSAEKALREVEKALAGVEAR